MGFNGDAVAPLNLSGNTINTNSCLSPSNLASASKYILSMIGIPFSAIIPMNW